MGKARISTHRIMSTGECTPQPEHNHTGTKKCIYLFPIFLAPGAVRGTAITRTGPRKGARKNIGNRSDSGLPTFCGAIGRGMSRPPRWEGPEAAAFEMGVGWAQNTCRSVAQSGKAFQRVPGPGTPTSAENHISFTRPGTIKTNTPKS